MKNRGFTLLELMITVLVVGVLSTIALSSYRSYTLRANRVDGTGMLLKIAVAEEKYFLQNSTYATDLVSAPPTGLGLGSTSPAGLYNLTVAAGSTGAIGTSFTATATATGSQANDIAACRTLTINDQGQRTPTDASGCWR